MTTQPHPLSPTSPWHTESYDTFINEQLPQLLAARLPLAGYRVTQTSEQTCTVAVAIRNGNGEIEVEYPDIPVPSERGTFQIDGKEFVVIPLALDDHLDQAEIHCVGEQLYTEIETQLGEAPEHIPWDAALLNAWLPLTKWITEFISGRGQILDTTNWLSEERHMRAILIPDRQKLFTHGHFGVSTQAGDALQHTGFVCHVAFYRGQQVGYEFMTALQLHVDTRPGLVNLVA